MTWFMVPCDFAESNLVLDKPPSMTRDECTPLSVLYTKTADDKPVVISCWKLTRDELDEIIRTGRVWLTVYGSGMPPVALGTDKPFETVPEEAA